VPVNQSTHSKRRFNSTRTSHSNPKAKNSLQVSGLLIPPRRDGAIEGVGEKFAANALTSTGLTTVPSRDRVRRSASRLQLTFAGHYHAGNEPFSYGCGLSQSALPRKTQKGLLKSPNISADCSRVWSREILS
jgi:hypothetical protein